MSEENHLPATALLGFGTMGRALATGLLAQGLATPQTLRVGARRPDVARAHAEPLGLAAVHPEEAADHAQILVLEAMAEGAVMRGMPRAVALEDGRIRSVLARGVETVAKVAGELAS